MIMSKDKYQEAFSNYFTAKLQFDNEMYKSMELLEELVDLYPEYLELKAKATPKKPTYSQNDMEFQCKCVNEVRRYENFCSSCGQAIDWSG